MRTTTNSPSLPPFPHPPVILPPGLWPPCTLVLLPAGRPVDGGHPRGNQGRLLEMGEGLSVLNLVGLGDVDDHRAENVFIPFPPGPQHPRRRLTQPRSPPPLQGQGEGGELETTTAVPGDPPAGVVHLCPGSYHLTCAEIDCSQNAQKCAKHVLKLAVFQLEKKKPAINSTLFTQCTLHGLRRMAS